MSGFTDLMENNILKHILCGVAYTAPETKYIALFTADPTEAGVLTNEVTGNGYARQVATFSTPTTGSSTNSADIAFPLAAGAWGTVTHIAIMDTLTAGNALFVGSMSTPQSVILNNQLVFKAGQIVVNLD